MKEKITELSVNTVGPTIQLINKNGLEGVGYGMSVRRNPEYPGISYYEIKDLKNTEKVKLLVNDMTVDLPEDLEINLGKYLRSQNQTEFSEGFSCVSFVKMMLGMDYENNILDAKDFKFEKVLKPQDVMLPGEALLIANSVNDESGKQTFKLVHVALCIGRDIFISKGGEGSRNLLTSDFDNMFKVYPGNTLFRLIKKDESLE